MERVKIKVMCLSFLSSPVPQILKLNSVLLFTVINMAQIRILTL